MGGNYHGTHIYGTRGGNRNMRHYGYDTAVTTELTYNGAYTYTRNITRIDSAGTPWNQVTRDLGNDTIPAILRGTLRTNVIK